MKKLLLAVLTAITLFFSASNLLAEDNYYTERIPLGNNTTLVRIWDIDRGTIYHEYIEVDI